MSTTERRTRMSSCPRNCRMLMLRGAVLVLLVLCRMRWWEPLCSESKVWRTSYWSTVIYHYVLDMSYRTDGCRSPIWRPFCHMLFENRAPDVLLGLLRRWFLQLLRIYFLLVTEEYDFTCCRRLADATFTTILRLMLGRGNNTATGYFFLQILTFFDSGHWSVSVYKPCK